MLYRTNNCNRIKTVNDVSDSRSFPDKTFVHLDFFEILTSKPVTSETKAAIVPFVEAFRKSTAANFRVLVETIHSMLNRYIFA